MSDKYMVRVKVTALIGCNTYTDLVEFSGLDIDQAKIKILKEIDALFDFNKKTSNVRKVNIEITPIVFI